MKHTLKWLLAASEILLASCGGGGSSGGGMPMLLPVSTSLSAVAGPDRALSPVSLSVQWPTGAGFIFARECRQPNDGGVSCFYFPNGGKIWNISWQSSIKVAHDEVLLMLLMSPTPQLGGATLLTTHHTAGNGSDCGAIISKDIVLQGFVEIPAGHYVWVYGEGNVTAHPAGVEVQATLYVEGYGQAVFP